MSAFVTYWSLWPSDIEDLSSAHLFGVPGCLCTLRDCLRLQEARSAIR